MSKITDETRVSILETAWRLMAEQQRLDVGMADIAAAAGVSRQTLFLAFGNRAGVLVAMARHQDTHGDHVSRMREIAATGADIPALHAFVDAWLDYLPVVYPVAIQLETSSLSDADANAAWQDRIFSQGVRMGLDRILGQIAAGGGLRADADPSRLADLCLTLLVPSAWRYLVVERAWTYEAFANSRHILIGALLASALPE
ncbi:MAG: TetR/AcrR family transcriptional regulator [Gammaproteobacteria bacterium]|nr:TetR/AcrR family transcriptional regulator [Gammaproteobacteria bacterium]MBU0785738.1 TetR/AcrR family transcriptional regulator [Gammaproteobacteria bacterium]MBU0813750.1 TetR/AcrR family transcriptional regulator [Gammaproteobacteria bacterium]MBU1788778.1 TetR/AcrR family transcriptional regulator [Gammaproteobacteria bacterium]